MTKWLNIGFYVYIAGCVLYLTYTNQYELALIFTGFGFYQLRKHYGE